MQKTIIPQFSTWNKNVSCSNIASTDMCTNNYCEYVNLSARKEEESTKEDISSESKSFFSYTCEEAACTIVDNNTSTYYTKEATKEIIDKAINTYESKECCERTVSECHDETKNISVLVGGSSESHRLNKCSKNVVAVERNTEVYEKNCHEDIIVKFSQNTYSPATNVMLNKNVSNGGVNQFPKRDFSDATKMNNNKISKNDSKNKKFTTIDSICTIKKTPAMNLLTQCKGNCNLLDYTSQHLSEAKQKRKQQLLEWIHEEQTFLRHEDWCEPRVIILLQEVFRCCMIKLKCAYKAKKLTEHDFTLLRRELISSLIELKREYRAALARHRTANSNNTNSNNYNNNVNNKTLKMDSVSNYNLPSNSETRKYCSNNNNNQLSLIASRAVNCIASIYPWSSTGFLYTVNELHYYNVYARNCTEHTPIICTTPPSSGMIVVKNNNNRNISEEKSTSNKVSAVISSNNVVQQRGCNNDNNSIVIAIKEESSTQTLTSLTSVSKSLCQANEYNAQQILKNVATMTKQKKEVVNKTQIQSIITHDTDACEKENVYTYNPSIYKSNESVNTCFSQNKLRSKSRVIASNNNNNTNINTNTSNNNNINNNNNIDNDENAVFNQAQMKRCTCAYVAHSLSATSFIATRRAALAFAVQKKRMQNAITATSPTIKVKANEKNNNSSNGDDCQTNNEVEPDDELEDSELITSVLHPEIDPVVTVTFPEKIMNAEHLLQSCTLQCGSKQCLTREANLSHFTSSSTNSLCSSAPAALSLTLPSYDDKAKQLCTLSSTLSPTVSPLNSPGLSTNTSEQSPGCRWPAIAVVSFDNIPASKKQNVENKNDNSSNIGINNNNSIYYFNKGTYYRSKDDSWSEETSRERQKFEDAVVIGNNNFSPKIYHNYVNLKTNLFSCLPTSDSTSFYHSGPSDLCANNYGSKMNNDNTENVVINMPINMKNLSKCATTSLRKQRQTNNRSMTTKINPINIVDNNNDYSNQINGAKSSHNISSSNSSCSIDNSKNNLKFCNNGSFFLPRPSQEIEGSAHKMYKSRSVSNLAFDKSMPCRRLYLPDNNTTLPTANEPNLNSQFSSTLQSINITEKQWNCHSKCNKNNITTNNENCSYYYSGNNYTANKRCCGLAASASAQALNPFATEWSPSSTTCVKCNQFDLPNLWEDTLILNY